MELWSLSKILHRFLVYDKIMKITNLYKEKDNTEFKNNALHKENGDIIDITSELLVEHYTKVFINDQDTMSLVCTGKNLIELVIGRLISEGLLKDLNDIESIYICEYGLKARVYFIEGYSPFADMQSANDVASCCSDNKSYFKTATKPDPIKPLIELNDKEIFKLAADFSSDSKIHKMTAGTHAAYLYYEGETITSFEDIGRHNALDKVIGYIYLNNLIPEKCIVFTTGRVPVDMARKAIYAKLAALVSKSVPTADAVILAKEYNLNLVCRAWQDSYQIFNCAK